MMMFRALLAALLFANIHWIVAQDDEVMESTASVTEETEMLSTEEEMSSSMESTEGMVFVILRCIKCIERGRGYNREIQRERGSVCM